MQAYRDENSVPTKTAALNTDGTTVVRLVAVSNKLGVNIGVSGTDHGTVNAVRDQNSVPVLMAVSSVDGQTPVELYGDSKGNLLVKQI